MKKFLLFMLLLLLSTCQPVAAGTLGLKEGEKVIVYDERHRRIGTIENRGYGVLQLRNNQNRRVGTIEGTRTYDSKHRRTGTIDWNKPNPFWR